MKSKLLLASAVFSGAMLLTACETIPKTGLEKKTPTVELSVIMDEAEASIKAGQKDAGLNKFSEAAKLYPAAKQPWLRIAQLHYDAANYGDAIVAAQQVSARDDKDKVALSILSVSGLRVSTKALADLGRQNQLTGSIRTEAQDLARTLRDSLGERVLVPVSTPTSSPESRPAPPRVVAKPPADRPAAAPPAKPTTGGGSSPFGVLQ